ncbi:ATP-binding cassette domain-containing protein [Herbiconiux sp. A18JL235]|uniref:ATP-binding cassette domain-containing protein n=1 Tax=Herbiconiux sp. A18JL235 TaxID=3152363 RepID=A0AB39BFD8_9MICO
MTHPACPVADSRPIPPLDPVVVLDSLLTLRAARVDLGGRTMLHPSDVDVRRGEIVVIAGANGAGKSTLLEVVAGVRPMTAGSRVVTGSAAFVPQRAVVPDDLPVTVRDVVAVGAWGRAGLWRPLGRAARDSIDDGLRRLGIAPLVRRPYARLSGGQRQRALLAQAVVRGADLLLLDEPTTGLDDESAARILTVLREEAARGAGVLCVSHDPVVLAAGDRVLRLEGGHLETTAPATLDRPISI